VFDPGQRLAELELSKKLTMSRSPIREALQVLANEGLVRIVPNRGAFVVLLDPQGIEELYEVREALEVGAVRLASARADPVGLSSLRLTLKATALALEQDGGRPYPAQLDFHARVAQLARNPVLEKMLREIDLQLRLARGRSGFNPQRARQALDDHLEIYGYLASGDRDQAAEAMRRHIRASLASVLEVLHTEASRVAAAERDSN
jgi:DNA-binding GntR family transcriptional regulator